MMLQAKIPLIHIFVLFCVWNEIITIIMTTCVSLPTLVFPMMLSKKKDTYESEINIINIITIF